MTKEPAPADASTAPDGDPAPTGPQAPEPAAELASDDFASDAVPSGTGPTAGPAPGPVAPTALNRNQRRTALEAMTSAEGLESPASKKRSRVPVRIFDRSLSAGCKLIYEETLLNMPQSTGHS